MGRKDKQNPNTPLDGHAVGQDKARAHSAWKTPTTPDTATSTVQTMARRPVLASMWVALTLVGALLVHEAHGLQILPLSLGLDMRAFYLGWILIWVSPVIAFLTYLGGRMGRAEWVSLGAATAFLWCVDT